MTPAGWTQLIFEYWDVPEENWDWWSDYYQRNVVDILRGLEGHAGTSVMLRPGMPWRKGPHRVSYPHPQMQLRPVQDIEFSTPREAVGPIRSNISIDLHALLQHEWTHAAVHFMTAMNLRLHHQWIEGWAQRHPEWAQQYPQCVTAEDALSEEFFSRVNNHWDVTFDVTSVRSPETGSQRG